MIEAVQNGVYIATYWKNPQLRFLREAVYAHRFVSTGSWIDIALSGRAYEWGDILSEESRSNAEMDMNDIRRSAAVLTIPSRTEGVGHHHEYGFALALRKPIVAIGEPWGVFHSLADSWHGDVGSALARIRRLISVRTEPQDAL